jgi:hypothetical protein
VRDEFESKKQEIEERISEVLCTPWTIEANYLAIFPYAEDWARNNLGACMYK